VNFESRLADNLAAIRPLKLKENRSSSAAKPSAKWTAKFRKLN